MLPTKIVAIGAGSAQFGLGNLANIMKCEKLKGSTLALVDINTEGLKLITQLAERMNKEWGSGIKIESSTNRREVLDGAEFVIVSVAVDREKTWRLDWEIPLKYGVRQPLGENGGPGAFSQTARNTPIFMDIARDMEKLCPEAWLLNYSNPVPRLCLALSRYTKVKAIGVCHQIMAGYMIVGGVLAEDLGIPIPEKIKKFLEEPKMTSAPAPDVMVALRSLMKQVVPMIDIKAAGLNHFTWILDIRNAQTGEDLYPLFAKRIMSDEMKNIMPLSREMFNAFGIFPAPGDGHMAEYLPWCHDQRTKPWEKYRLELYDWDGAEKERDKTWERIAGMVSGKVPIDGLKEVRSERAVEIILGIAENLNSYELALNIPNKGHITNLPESAIVEVPTLLSGKGPIGLAMGDLPEPVAYLCRNQITIAELEVEAAVKGCKKTALQAILLDPMINDIDTAKNILDDYLRIHAKYLPQFK